MAVDMCSTWLNVEHMAKMIQVRHVPIELHRALKIRAAERGMTLSDYVLSELDAIVAKPTLAELAAELASEEPMVGAASGAELIRAQRGPLP